MTFVEEEEFDLAALWHLLWRYRRLVAIVSLIGGLAAGLLAFLEKPYFRADVVVTEAQDRGIGGMSSLANQLGGLASLAGVNLAPANLAASQESAAVLESRHLAEEFIKRNGLQPELLRGSDKILSLWRAVDQFKKGVVTIRKDLRRGVTTVSVQWTDPVTTARWANGYVALANELIRSRAMDDATRNIAYLNDQISKTNVVELRKVMYDLIENETKTLMIAKGRPDYAFEVVDPAVAPELKAGPHRIARTLVGLTVGFCLAAVIAFALDYIVRDRRRGQARSGKRDQPGMSAVG
jgi:uncharacterized protein involved in exopolysaccharide biosynthesis